MGYLFTDKDTLKKLKKQSENINSSSNAPFNAVSTRTTNINAGNPENNSIMNKNIKELKKTVEYKTDVLSFDEISNKVSIVIEGSQGTEDIRTAKI